VRLRTLSDQTLISAAVAGNDGVHDLKTIESTSAFLAYGLTHDFTVSMRLPWVGRTGMREGNAADPLNPIVVDRGNTFGFSDVTFLGEYRFYNDKKAHTDLAVLLGVKAPTGLTNRVDNQGQLFDAEFQPGTGAWNGLFGLAVTKRFGSWSLDASGRSSVTLPPSCPPVCLVWIPIATRLATWFSYQRADEDLGILRRYHPNVRPVVP
jgi:hypothetical protein